MVNLLPQKDIHTLVRAYYVRMATLLIALLCGVVLVGTLLLIAPFVLAEDAAEEGERFAVALEEAVGLRERSGVSGEVAVLAERVRALQEFSAPQHNLSVIDVLVRNTPQAVAITALSFRGNENSISVAIAGRAETRAALLAYVNQLRNVRNFHTVEVPVSQLALDADIPFSLSAQYTP